MLKIDLLSYLSNEIGMTNWYGDELFDEVSLKNMDKLETYLTKLEEVREILLNRLIKHKEYRKNNESAKALHDKAGAILCKHRLQEYVGFNFYEYWENGGE